MSLHDRIYITAGLEPLMVLAALLQLVTLLLPLFPIVIKATYSLYYCGILLILVAPLLKHRSVIVPLSFLFGLPSTIVALMVYLPNWRREIGISFLSLSLFVKFVSFPSIVYVAIIGVLGALSAISVHMNWDSIEESNNGSDDGVNVSISGLNRRKTGSFFSLFGRMGSQPYNQLIQAMSKVFGSLVILFSLSNDMKNVIITGILIPTILFAFQDIWPVLMRTWQYSSYATKRRITPSEYAKEGEVYTKNELEKLYEFVSSNPRATEHLKADTSKDMWTLLDQRERDTKMTDSEESGGIRNDIGKPKVKKRKKR